MNHYPLKDVSFEDDALLFDTHTQLKEEARIINDEQEFMHNVCVDAISSFDDEQQIMPCDEAIKYFAEAHDVD